MTPDTTTVLSDRLHLLQEETAALTRQVHAYTSLAEFSADSMVLFTSDGTLIYANPVLHHLVMGESPLIGDSFTRLLTPDPTLNLMALLPIATADGVWQGITRLYCADALPIPVQLTIFPVDSTHPPALFGAIARDLSSQFSAQQDQLALQEQVIAMQHMTLQELSTPLMPITGDVIAMPLIGAIDSDRAQQIIDTLLQGVSQQRTRIVILDITGVQVVDTQVANALIRAAQAVQLLGAQVILTGIRPEIAQTLVSLNIRLDHLVTLNSLQDGIAYALYQRPGVHAPVVRTF